MIYDLRFSIYDFQFATGGLKAICAIASRKSKSVFLHGSDFQNHKSEI